MPQQKDEIAIDRMYADNNDLQVGDVISVDKKELTVTGLVALSDYSALFSNSSDMMFDAVKFGVGIMTEEGYDAITDDHIKYCYSWKYDTEPKDENEEKEWSDDFVEVLAGTLPRPTAFMTSSMATSSASRVRVRMSFFFIIQFSSLLPFRPESSDTAQTCP